MIYGRKARFLYLLLRQEQSIRINIHFISYFSTNTYFVANLNETTHMLEQMY